MKTSAIGLSVLLFAMCIVNAFSQEVTTANFTSRGWGEVQVTIDPATKDTIRSLNTDNIELRCGPINRQNRSLKRGSMYLSLPKNTGDPSLPNKANNPLLYRVLLTNNLQHGTKLRDITALSYSTYAEAHPGTTGPGAHAPGVPLLLLQVDLHGDGSEIDNINYDPNYQPDDVSPDGSVLHSKGELGESVGWQEWNAFDGWWRFYERDPSHSHEPIAELIKFSDFVDKFTDAQIVNTEFERPMGGAGIRFLLGSDPKRYNIDYRGYLDGFKLGTKAIDQPSPFHDFVATEKCATDPVIEPIKLAIYFILSGLAIWGCFILLRRFRGKKVSNVRA